MRGYSNVTSVSLSRSGCCRNCRSGLYESRSWILIQRTRSRDHCSDKAPGNKSSKISNAFHGSSHFSRIGLNEGGPTRPVRFENLLTRPDSTRELSNSF